MTSQIEIETINNYLISHMSSNTAHSRLIHLHPNAYEFNLIKSGNVDFLLEDRSYHLKAGDITIVRPNELHGYFSNDDSIYERYPVHIEDQFLKSLCTEKTDLLSCFSHRSPRHLDRNQVQLFEFYVDTCIKALKDQSFGYDVRLRASLTMLILLIDSSLPAENVPPGSLFSKPIQDALVYINQNFAHDISLQEIADAANISRSRLCHIFKELMGMSPWNYVIIQRIQHAQALLNSGSSITDACYECGFQDYSHFVKIFHKFSGVTPGRYVKERPIVSPDSAVMG